MNNQNLNTSEENAKMPSEKKKTNKILMIAGIILAACICLAVIAAAVFMALRPALNAVNEQAFGYTGIASEQLKSDVLKAIADNEQAQNGCAEVSLLNGHMFAQPNPSDNNSWSETWQVIVCGESRLYSINFTPSPQGGTDFSVDRVDQ